MRRNAILVLINPPWLFPEEVLARPRIETDDGEPIRVTAIRMKRPPASR